MGSCSSICPEFMGAWSDKMIYFTDGTQQRSAGNNDQIDVQIERTESYRTFASTYGSWVSDFISVERIM